MQQGEASTENLFMKRVSVRSGGAGHAHSGVIETPDSKSGTVTGSALDERATVLRSTNNIIVKLGT